MKKNKIDMSIEEDILLLQEKGKNTSLSMGEILNILSGKGLSLIILFLSLPFCQPLQIPGISTPFGAAIAFIGLKMTFGKYTWHPKRILAVTIPSHSLEQITEKTLWLLRKMKHWVYPRLTWLCYYPAAHIVNGLLIFILGILLALPIPAPFSNMLVAWALLFIGLGSLEDDGLFILMGYFVSLVTFAYFAVIILLIQHIL